MHDPRSIRVGVLFGGRSSEHEVSLASAATVLDALEKAGYQTIPVGITKAGCWITGGDPLARLHAQAQDRVSAPDQEPNARTELVPVEAPLPPVDVIFPVLHGPFGEDGTVQGLLEMADLPYVGCGVLASAVGMDKAVSKQLFAAAGLPQTPYQVILRRAWRREPASVLTQVEEALAYPMFVKPANLGSSVGISKVRNRQELAAGLDEASRYDRKLVVEQAVPQAREIEVSILGNDRPEASVPGEIIPCNEFYDYAAKYLDDRSQLLIPAPIPEELAAAARDMAVRAFRALDGAGLARVDFLLDQAGRLHLNEVNTMPGFTQASMYPKLWEASGLPLPALVTRLVDLALERYAERSGT